MSPLIKEYKYIKSKYPDAIILFAIHGFIECFYECAIKTSKILDLPLTKSKSGYDLCGFNSINIDTNIRKILKSNTRVVLIEQKLLNPKTSIKRITKQ